MSRRKDAEADPPLPDLLDRHAMLPPDVRHRVLKAAELCCAVCGAEDNRDILRYLSRWPDTAWVPYIPGTLIGTGYVVRIKLIVVANTWPWSGRDEDLTVLCMGCAIHREVEMDIERWRSGPTPRHQSAALPLFQVQP